MLPSTIENLNNGSADLDFDLLYTEGRKSFRTLDGATQDEPEILTVSHNESGSGENLFRNSVARIDKTVTDAEGNQNTISVYVVIRNPLKTATSAQVLGVLNTLSALIRPITGASTPVPYGAQIVDGEI